MHKSSNVSTFVPARTRRDASIAACRAAARSASAQANLRAAAFEAVDTLESINCESAIARTHQALAVEARAQGLFGDAECLEATASFVSTQVERMCAEPVMVRYAAALVEVEDAIAADRAAMRDLNSFGLDA